MDLGEAARGWGHLRELLELICLDDGKKPDLVNG